MVEYSEPRCQDAWRCKTKRRKDLLQQVSSAAVCAIKGTRKQQKRGRMPGSQRNLSAEELSGKILRAVLTVELNFFVQQNRKKIKSSDAVMICLSLSVLC